MRGLKRIFMSIMSELRVPDTDESEVYSFSNLLHDAYVGRYVYDFSDAPFSAWGTSIYLTVLFKPFLAIKGRPSAGPNKSHHTNSRGQLVFVTAMPIPTPGPTPSAATWLINASFLIDPYKVSTVR